MPGDKLQATTLSGVKVKLAVPAGAEPGTILTFSLPAAVGSDDKQAKAAIVIQARLRGSRTRSSLGTSPRGTVTNPIELATPEVFAAATKVQATFRGHAVRNEQQEASRLEWMAYYMQPEVSQWDEALALAVTPEEEQQVAAAKAGIAYEEEKRLKWFQYYLGTSDFDKATELVISPVEQALVLKARSQDVPGLCACLSGSNPNDAENERAQQFVKAIREYDWDVAAALAVTEEELQDVSDSKVRVSTMDAAIQAGDKSRAYEYAITEEERTKITELL